MAIQGTRLWLALHSLKLLPCDPAQALGSEVGWGWDLLTTLLELGCHLYPGDREGLPKVTTSCLQM